MKPGFKTTEFWLSLVAVLVSALLASDLIPSESVWLKVAALVSSALAAMGYAGARAFAKSAESTAKAVEATTPKP